MSGLCLMFHAAFGTVMNSSSGVISERLTSAHKAVVSGRGPESLESQARQLESHMTMFRELLLELRKGTALYVLQCA